MDYNLNGLDETDTFEIISKLKKKLTKNEIKDTSKPFHRKGVTDVQNVKTKCPVFPVFRDTHAQTECSLWLCGLAGSSVGTGEGVLSCVLCRTSAVAFRGPCGKFPGFSLHTCWLNSSAFGVSPAEKHRFIALFFVTAKCEQF